MKVFFILDPGDWHGTPAESLWAEPIAGPPGACLLRNTPFFAKGVSFLDKIQVARKNDGALEFSKVLAHSGNSTYRIVRQAPSDVFDPWWDRLEALGCTYEHGRMPGGDVYAVNVPIGADVRRAYSVMAEGEAIGVWIFEEGHCGHPGEATVS